MSKNTMPVTSENKLMKDSILNRFDIQREKDKEMVRGKFINHETPGGNVGFPFKKYKGDALITYDFKDNEIYTIPLAVARHLNTNCSYPSYNYKNDENGRPTMTISERVRRFSFHSLEFLDNEPKYNNEKYDASALPRS